METFTFHGNKLFIGYEKHMKKAGYACYMTLHMKFMVLKIIDISWDLFHRIFSCKILCHENVDASWGKTFHGL